MPSSFSQSDESFSQGMMPSHGLTSSSTPHTMMALGAHGAVAGGAEGAGEINVLAQRVEDIHSPLVTTEKCSGMCVGNGI